MKGKLLFTAVVMFIAANAMAQTDVTPEGWKLKERGSARSMFLVDAAKIGSNLSYAGEGGEEGHKGFRRADNLPGVFVMNHYTGEGAEHSQPYEKMTEAQKQTLENFYEAMQIVDGGSLGNILCYQGAGSTVVDARAVKNKSAMVAPQMNIFTPKTLPDGLYRMSLSVRVILNPTVEKASIGLYLATSWGDNVYYAGSNPDTQIHFQMECMPATNAYWTTYQYEFKIDAATAEGANPLYDLLPLDARFGMGEVIANNSIMLMKAPKIEKINAPTLGGKLNIIPEDWNDASGVTRTLGEDLIVFANQNGITVIDAKAPIEVYNISGQLIEKKEPNASSCTVIPVTEKGAYIVKVGKISRKVVF